MAAPAPGQCVACAPVNGVTGEVTRGDRRAQRVYPPPAGRAPKWLSSAAPSGCQYAIRRVGWAPYRPPTVRRCRTDPHANRVAGGVTGVAARLNLSSRAAYSNGRRFPSRFRRLPRQRGDT